MPRRINFSRLVQTASPELCLANKRNGKLCPQDVQEIRHLYELGMSQGKIKKLYAEERGVSISQPMIHYIVSRKRRADVP